MTAEAGIGPILVLAPIGRDAQVIAGLAGKSPIPPPVPAISRIAPA